MKFRPFEMESRSESGRLHAVRYGEIVKLHHLKFQYTNIKFQLRKVTFILYIYIHYHLIHGNVRVVEAGSGRLVEGVLMLKPR